jgi:hypothetical protein
MQQRMKVQADKHRRERVFAIGDKVFLRLQPYIQASVAKRANHKLAFKFFGPFRVVDRIGQVAYKLDLPAASKVHPVFHVSQLKPCVGPGVQVSSSLPPASALFQVPVAVLQQRVLRRGHRTVVQGLVQWSGTTADQATWENLDALNQQFPQAPAWGQAEIQEGGNVNDLETTEDDAGATAGTTDEQQRQARPVRVRRGPRWLTDGNWAT